MDEQRVANQKRVLETFAAVRTTIRCEKRRTATERRAFEMFADRVDEVDCSNTDPGVQSKRGAKNSHGGTIVKIGGGDPSGDSPIEAIRRAYEETVMAVSFYDEEYGDDYVQSLRGEFGPEMATALTDQNCFGPTAKTALIDETESAVRERGQLIATCVRERESLDATAETLLPVVSELDNIGAVDPETDSFGTLEARWNRVRRLREYCEEAAENRQTDINEQRSQYDLPIDAPDICAYLYESHHSSYPILSVCADLAQRLDRIQTNHERAMVRC